MPRTLQRFPARGRGRGSEATGVQTGSSDYALQRCRTSGGLHFIPDTACPAARPPHPNSLSARGERSWRYSRANRSRSELAMTETELKLIAAAATIGLSNRPKAG